MKYLCIGDIHGKVEIIKDVMSDKYNDYHKVFVGDYLDSYDRTVEEQIEGLQYLLECVKSRTDVTCLIGNHELSYLKEGMVCSGFNPATAAHLVHMREEVLSNFVTHLWLTDDILVTHAGATQELFENKEQIKKALEEEDESLYDIGAYRGGIWPVGGIFWCDFWAEYQEIEGLTQIVGHSSQRPQHREGVIGVVKKDNCFNIDCLDRVLEFLTVDTDKKDMFKVIKADRAP